MRESQHATFPPPVPTPSPPNHHKKDKDIQGKENFMQVMSFTPRKFDVLEQRKVDVHDVFRARKIDVSNISRDKKIDVQNIH